MIDNKLTNNQLNKKPNDKKLIKILLEQIKERDYLILSLKSNIEDLSKSEEIHKEKEKKYKHTIYILVCLLLLSILINILSIMYL